MDPIMPLTAGVLCVEGGLPRDESLALTAAALVIPGALALAPALIAVERQRQANEKKDNGEVGVAPPPKAEKPPPKVVGPALVLVPNVVGNAEDEARKKLEDAQFKVVVGYNVSDAANDKKVIVQRPAASAIPVAEGSMVTLKIGAMPPAPPVSEDQKAIAELKADIGGQLGRMNLAIEGLVAELKASRATNEALLKQKN